MLTSIEKFQGDLIGIECCHMTKKSSSKIVACFKIRPNVIISQKFSYSNFKTESLRDAEIFTCNVREKPLDFMLKIQSIIRSHFVLGIVRSILLLFKLRFKKFKLKAIDY